MKDSFNTVLLACVIWPYAVFIIIKDFLVNLIIYIYQLMEAFFWTTMLVLSCLFTRARRDLRMYRNR